MSNWFKLSVVWIACIFFVAVFFYHVYDSISFIAPIIISVVILFLVHSLYLFHPSHRKLLKEEDAKGFTISTWLYLMWPYLLLFLYAWLTKWYLNFIVELFPIGWSGLQELLFIVFVPLPFVTCLLLLDIRLFSRNKNRLMLWKLLGSTLLTVLWYWLLLLWLAIGIAGF